MRVRYSEPVKAANLVAAFLARYPMTPERAASNARILEEETAAYEADHPSEAEEVTAA